MKRKSKKLSKNPTKAENGIDSKANQNGNSSDGDEIENEPEEKKRKIGKRKSSTTLSKSSEDMINDDAQYEVEAILDDKNIRGVKHYLIRWKGYEPESDTWEPESTLNCGELITEYKAKLKKKKKSKSTQKSKMQPDWNENENFEVDRILEVHFKKNGKREFLVSWKGYPKSQSSWEPEDNMNCPDLIDRFMLKVERAKEMEQKELRVKRSHTDRFTLTMSATGRRLSKRNQGKQRVHYHDAE